jgi:hypothetical protein
LNAFINTFKEEIVAKMPKEKVCLSHRASGGEDESAGEELGMKEADVRIAGLPCVLWWSGYQLYL